MKLRKEDVLFHCKWRQLIRGIVKDNDDDCVR